MDQKTLSAKSQEVFNVATELPDINLFTTDRALQEAVEREGGNWGREELTNFGQLTGRQAYRQLGYLANRYLPELDTHDRFGKRVDLVRYHPAYHQLMEMAITQGLHCDPWINPRPGAQVVRAAKYLMQTQVEAGHGCPVTMTFAAIPSLGKHRRTRELFVTAATSKIYDPTNKPYGKKAGITVGMGMTEKQGGSDVRANTSYATPGADFGAEGMFSLQGHKWFLSAPMSDLFLMLAQTEGGLSCFAVPRWLPDGSKNGLHLVRLKDKMGNRSNASAEVELREARAWLLGEEGRGVASIIDMVSLTRFDCMIGSSAAMRAGLLEVMHHCSQRAAFGAKLIQQPLMRNVIADLCLDYEAALAFTMRMARALDQRADEQPAKLLRIATAIGKYWICKRGPQHAYEIMECVGGNGVIENSVYPRLFRDSVINPIWEGSGNIQCLDVLRAIDRDPQVLAIYMDEVNQAQGLNDIFDVFLENLKQELAQLENAHRSQLQFSARSIVDKLALAFQASLLLLNSPAELAAAYCQARLEAGSSRQYGALAKAKEADCILGRAGLSW